MSDATVEVRVLTPGQRSACSDMQKRIDRQNAEIDRLKEKLREARSERDIQMGRAMDLRAELAAHAVIDVPAGVPSVEELIGVARNARPDYAIDSAQVTAIRDRILAGLAQPSSNAEQFDEVEALARVLRAQYWGEDRWDGEILNANKEDWLGVARAAIAHLRKRPEGLPTAEELVEIALGTSEPHGVSHRQVAAILTALTPYLRDPVGWELDLQPHELRKAYYDGMWDEAIALIRSRIRPVYECKECANWKAHAAAIEDSSFDMIKRINLARAVLEGE